MLACSKPTPIAELVKVEDKGGVERQQGSGTWTVAQVGARYFIGDAARTGDQPAQLRVAGTALIVMQGNTTLRFSGTEGAAKISVEAGAIELSGAGSFGLDIGEVTLSRDGKVRITAQGNGHATIELTLGGGKVRAASGEAFDLTLNRPVDVGKDAVVPMDAGVPDAPVPVADAAIDAELAGAGDATIAVTGRRAEVQAPGTTGWRPLAPGMTSLAPGSAVRLGTATTAKLTAGGVALELAGGSRVRLDDHLAITLEVGAATAEAAVAASVAVPGGALALKETPGTSASARLDSGGRETRVAMLRGGGTLTGETGAELALSRGESATLTRAGAIRVVEAIPSYFDIRIPVGESLTIHDPKPPTAVQFQFDGKCREGGLIEVDRSNAFRTAKVSAGRDVANMLLTSDVVYRLRCTEAGVEGPPVAAGRISVRRDDGRRPLPKIQGVNDIDVDGRNYRISYQSAIPSVAVNVRNPGRNHVLHLASGGKEQTFSSSTPKILVPGAQLHEGQYTYWIDRDGVKQDKVSSLTIDFDQTAPQVYIESPINGQPWSGDIDVRGAVLPGWSAAVDAIAIPIDGQRRFAAKVGIPGGNALAIRLSHPQRGVHYYLRRQK